jgi:hypothetical protein
MVEDREMLSQASVFQQHDLCGLTLYVNLHGGKPSETAMRKSPSVIDTETSMRTNAHPLCLVRSIQRQVRDAWYIAVYVGVAMIVSVASNAGVWWW